MFPPFINPPNPPSIGGAPLTSYPSLDPKTLESIASLAKKKAYEIINLKGATHFGIGAVVSHICEAVLLNQNRYVCGACFE